MTTLSIVERYGRFLAITAATTPGFYTITHLPTGASLTGRVACLACTRHVAVDIASYRVPWSTLTADNRHGWFRSNLPAELFDKFVLEFARMGDRCWAHCPKVVVGGERVGVLR